MGSSSLLEFFISLVIGVLAVLGGLFCIAFLLVEPIRSPPSEGPTIPISEILKSSECGDLIVRMEPLPPGCVLDNQSSIPLATCFKNSCSCPEDLLTQNALCCCRATNQGVVQGIQCRNEAMTPRLINITNCGCGLCDVEVVIDLTVVATGSGDPIPAAVVYLNSTMIGMTETFGLFRYRTMASGRSLVFSITASGYLTQFTDLLVLSPLSPLIMRRVTMLPNMDVVVGMGDAPIHLDLSSMLSISAPPGIFETLAGEPYVGLVTYKGNVVDISDSTAVDSIPSSDLEYLDADTGLMVRTGMIAGIVVLFVSDDGSTLVVKGNLTLTISLPEESGNGNDETIHMFVLNYDPSSATWNKMATLNEVDPLSRRKRQAMGPPRVFEGGIGNTLELLSVIGVAFAANCWLQARVFPVSSGLTPPNSIITMEQNVLVSNLIVLVRINTFTNGFQTSTDGLASNAVCTPTMCNNIISGSLVAADTNIGMVHIPIQFGDTAFDSVEDAPIIVSTEFAFDAVIVQTTTRPRPFYSDLDSCTTQGQETNADSSSDDYFSFQDVDQLDLLTSADTCFIKIQIRDCFTNNVVRITVVDDDIGSEPPVFITIFEPAPPLTTEPLTTDPLTTDPLTTNPLTTDPLTTDAEVTMGSGDGATTGFITEDTTMAQDPITTAQDDTATTAPPDATTAPPDATTPQDGTTQGPFVCNADTATLRAACIQYSCGDLVRILVSPSPESDETSNFCGVTERSVILSTDFFPNNGIVTQLVVDTEDVLASSYNDPLLGLYADTSESATATIVAMQRCNAGVGEGTTATSIDVEAGIAAVFSCFS